MKLIFEDRKVSARLYSCIGVLAHKYGLLGGLWFCLVVSGLMTAGARGLTVSQLERLDPRGESTSRLLEVCRELLRNEQHAEAVPFSGGGGFFGWRTIRIRRHNRRWRFRCFSCLIVG